MFVKEGLGIACAKEMFANPGWSSCEFIDFNRAKKVRYYTDHQNGLCFRSGQRVGYERYEQNEQYERKKKLLILYFS